jgi:hypothetical protein
MNTIFSTLIAVYPWGDFCHDFAYALPGILLLANYAIELVENSYQA